MSSRHPTWNESFRRPSADFQGRDFALSPDGSRIVYVGADAQLYQRPLNAMEGYAIAGAQPGRSPFFSPDGNSIGFSFGEGTSDRVSTVALSGGSPIPVGNAGGGILASFGTWLEDDYVYYFEESPAARLMRAPSQGGVAESVETDAEVVFPAAMVGVTDRLLVTTASGGGIGILDLGSGAVEPVTGLDNSWDAQYANGFLFWVTGDGILAAAKFDPAAGQLTSVPVNLAEGVEPGGYTVSQTGILMFRGGGAASAVSGETPGWIARNGDTEIIKSNAAVDAGRPCRLPVGPGRTQRYLGATVRPQRLRVRDLRNRARNTRIRRRPDKRRTTRRHTVPRERQLRFPAGHLSRRCRE